MRELNIHEIMLIHDRIITYMMRNMRNINNETYELRVNNMGTIVRRQVTIALNNKFPDFYRLNDPEKHATIQHNVEKFMEYSDEEAAQADAFFVDPV